MRTGIVFIGGDAPSRSVIDALPEADLVVAADSGFDHAVAVGVHVDVLVGDLDSISQEGRRSATADGIRIERHRPDKDETDTELAVGAVMDDGCRRIIGVSAVGDRIDHFLATVAVFAGAAAQGGTCVTLWVGSTRIEFVTPTRPVELLSPNEALFTVLAQGGFVDGLVIDGARYPLDGVSLSPASARGSSNVSPPGVSTRVSVTAGTALVIVPPTDGGVPQ